MVHEPSEPALAVVETRGRLLFEDSYNSKSHLIWYTWLGILAISIGLFFIFLFILSPVGIDYFTLFSFYSPARDGLIYLSICFFSILFGIFLFRLRKEYHRFRLFEDGISFTVPVNNPFLPFNQIDFITKADYDRITIYRKSPGTIPLTISSSENQIGAHDVISDRARFLDTFGERLKRAHPDRSETSLIRDYKNVGWTSEALEALENRLRWGLEGSEVARWTNEEILKSGRDRVDLSDIHKFLK